MKVSLPLLNTSSSNVLAVRMRTGPSLSEGGSSLFTHLSSLPAWDASRGTNACGLAVCNEAARRPAAKARPVGLKHGRQACLAWLA